MIRYLIPFLLIPFAALSQTDETIFTCPEEITQYYEDLNLVNSISTPSERVQLTQYFEKDTFKSDTERLTLVAQILEKIEPMVIQFESRMPNSMESKPEHSPQIFQKVDWRPVQENFIVKVKVFQLSTVENLSLISMYEKDAENFEPLVDMNATTIPVIHEEFHEWVKVDGKWRKKELNKILTEN